MSGTGSGQKGLSRAQGKLLTHQAECPYMQRSGWRAAKHNTCPQEMSPGTQERKVRTQESTRQSEWNQEGRGDQPTPLRLNMKIRGQLPRPTGQIPTISQSLACTELGLGGKAFYPDHHAPDEEAWSYLPGLVESLHGVRVDPVWTHHSLSGVQWFCLWCQALQG